MWQVRLLIQDKQNNSTAECVAWKNEQLVYCGCTGEFAALLGVESVSDVIGKTDHDLMSGADVKRNVALDRNVLSSNIDMTCRGYLSTSEGAEIDVLVRVSSISGEAKGAAKLEITVIDFVIDLEEQETGSETYKKVLDQLDMGVFICDDARAIYANQKCADMLGYSIDEILALDDVFQLIVSADRSRIEQNASQQRRQSYELAVTHKNGGELLLEVSTSLLLWNDRPVTQVSLTDISQLIIVEEALSQATEVLHNERARLETKSNQIFSGLEFSVLPKYTSEESKPALTDSINLFDGESDKFREIAEKAPFGLMILDDFRPVFVNKKAALFFGYESVVDLLKHASIEAQIVANDLARLQSYHEARLAGRPAPGEYDFEVIKKSNNEIVKLHCIESSVVWNGKSAMHLTLFDANRFGTEIQQLKHTEARYKHFVEIASDFVIELDELFNISQLSSPLKVIQFQSAKKTIGKSFYDKFSQLGADQGQLSALLLMLENHKPFRDYQIKIIHQNDDSNIISISGSPNVHANGTFLGYRMIGKDVTIEHKRYQRLHFEAEHDALTNLVNRREFERIVSKALDATRGRKMTHALCYLDLDRFKIVNDQCGHLAGDELLRRLSEKMSEQLRGTDTLARLGGDEFGVFLNHCSIKEAQRIAKQLCKTVANFQFLWRENCFNVGVSIGVISISNSSGDLENVLLLADKACYKAKAEGRGRVVISESDEQSVFGETGDDYWTKAFESENIEYSFRLMKQQIKPVVRNSDTRNRYELLLRAVDKEGNFILPGQVLEVANRLNMLIKIDRWVFEQAIAFLSKQDAKEDISLCTINLSSASVLDVDYLDYLLMMIDKSGISPQLFGFEISESTAVMNITRTAYFIERIRSLGCSIILDNFGSGLSSFSYLSKLHADFLKIDGALVKKILEDPVSLVLLQSINDITHAMGMQTIASNVEDASIFKKLEELGIDYVQGYYISRLSPITY